MGRGYVFKTLVALQNGHALFRKTLIVLLESLFLKSIILAFMIAASFERRQIRILLLLIKCLVTVSIVRALLIYRAFETCRSSTAEHAFWMDRSYWSRTSQ